jgi:hypothetical protein
MQLNLKASGLEALFDKTYQRLLVAKLLGDERLEFTSREAWSWINTQIDDSISRASVINFMNSMVDEGIFGYREITGKGGHRRVYTSAIPYEELWRRALVDAANIFYGALGKKEYIEITGDVACKLTGENLPYE